MAILNELTSAQVRDIGIALNGGKSYGWRENLAVLTGASGYTIRSWCDNEATASHRTCAGPSARLLIILAHLDKSGIDLAEYMESFDGLVR